MIIAWESADEKSRACGQGRASDENGLVLDDSVTIQVPPPLLQSEMLRPLPPTE